MMDLEDRVRNTLHDLADTMPASRHARADFERRLANRRRGRGPVLAIAAAAAVVAGVAIPVALNRDTNHQVGTATTTPSAPTSQATGGPGAGTEADPFVIATVTDSGVEKAALLWVAEGSGGQQMCWQLRPVDENDSASPPAPECDPVPATWPNGPHGGQHVLTTGVLSSYIEGTGPVALRNLMVFVTAPNITRLDVRAGDGRVVENRNAFRLANGVTFSVADFGELPWGFGWTAWDAQGNVVESAIT